MLQRPGENVRNHSTIAKLSFEALESRRLLAADLIVEHDLLPAGNPDEEVTRVVRVHNVGDETARHTLIRSSLNDELDNATWQRSIGRGSFSADPTLGREPDLEIFGGTSNSVSEFVPIGDINGDGEEDLLVYRERRRDGRWMAGNSTILFSAITSTDTRVRAFDISNGSRGIHRGQLRALGDVNGDGFDDIGFLDRIIWGQEIMRNIDLSRRQQDKTTLFEWNSEFINRLLPIGDVNNDGFADLAVYANGRQLILGQPNLGDTTRFDFSELTPDQFVTLECNPPNGSCHAPHWRYGIYGASPIGDLNGDGLQDSIVGLSGVGSIVIYGNRELGGTTLFATSLGERGFLIPTQSGIQLGYDVTPAFFGDSIRYTPGGDFDGDGFEDLLLVMAGNDCDCTSSMRMNSDADGGAVVIFGGPHLGRGGNFREEESRTLKLRVTVNHDDLRPFAVARDVNADGRHDVVLSTEAVSYVIQDAAAAPDIDFGFGGPFWTESNTQLNGENGFGSFGNRSYVDLNRDGFNDEILFDTGSPAKVFWGPSQDPVPTPGTGNIEEVLDIPPGHSAVYQIRGDRRFTLQTISTTAIAGEAQRDEDLRDNYTSSQSAVLLDVQSENPECIAAGGEFECQITISNKGPGNASGVHVSGEFPIEMDSLSWHRSTTTFPPTLDLRSLNGADGVAFAGPTRVYTELSLAPGYDMPLFAGLGERVGSLGDTNGDGFDEFYGTGTLYDGWFPVSSDAPAIRFSGVPSFGHTGEFPPFESLDTPPPAAVIHEGDFNGDGILDRVTSNPEANEFRGETYVTYGDSDGIPDLPPGVLNGENGFVVTGARPNDRTGHSIALGDINNDNFDDLIIARGRNKWLEWGHGSYTSPPAVYVIFGSDATAERISVADTNESSGFQIKTFSEFNSVASDLDVNGDGIDDLLIGDVFGGVEIEDGLGRHHGGLFVIFGRQASSRNGYGPINDAVDIPRGSEITYTIRGTVPDGVETVLTTVSAAASRQVELDPRSNLEVVDIAIRTIGDANNDAVVDFADFLLLMQNFGRTDARYSDGDFNSDERVDFMDFLILSSGIQN